MSSESAVAKVPIGFGERGIQITSFEDLYRFGKAVIESGLAPGSFRKPEQVMVAVQFGAELGIGPMQALQSIAVIGGRPSLMVEPALSLVRRSGLLDGLTEEWTGKGDERCYRVSLQRGSEICTREFRMQDAQRAKLSDKDVWKSYPDRMLRARAIGFALRDLFPDVLRGIGIAEEQSDITRERNVTPRRDKPNGPDPLLARLMSGERPSVDVNTLNPEPIAANPVWESGSSEACEYAAAEPHVEAQNGGPKRPFDSAADLVSNSGSTPDSLPDSSSLTVNSLPPGLVKRFLNRVGGFPSGMQDVFKKKLLGELSGTFGPPPWSKESQELAAELVRDWQP
jgi:hypothetical protein